MEQSHFFLKFGSAQCSITNSQQSLDLPGDLPGNLMGDLRGIRIHHALLDPLLTSSVLLPVFPGAVQRTGRIAHILQAFITDFCQPLFERLCLGRWNSRAKLLLPTDGTEWRELSSPGGPRR